MKLNSFVLARKDPSALKVIIDNIIGFCVSAEYISETMIMIETCLDKDEILKYYSDGKLLVLEVEREELSLDAILDKISKTGINSLRNEEKYFLSELSSN